MSRAATPADVIAGAARWCVVEGDALDVVRTLPAGCLDALVTDPPSGIAFMGAEWDRDKGGRAQWVMWLATVLGLARAATRDGGRALVWSLPRTSHWTGCAVEDAGWSIESTITHLFGTGWPKGQSQLKPAAETWWLARTGRSEALNIEACRVGASKRVPGSLSVSQLNGYGVANRRGQSLDDSGHNPNVGRYPPNVVLSHSPGCRCVGERRVRAHTPFGPTRTVVGGGIASGLRGAPREKNPLTDHADPDGSECVEAWECVENCPVAELDRQSGDLHPPGNLGGTPRDGIGYGGASRSTEMPASHGDRGGASRFFPCFPADPLATTNGDGSIDSDGIGIRYREWENEDQSRAALTGITSPPRDTCGVSSTDGCGSHTSSSGSDTTGPSREGSKSTTGTATSKTTASKTSNSSTPQPTSDSTAGASFATESGGNRVPSAGSSRRSSSASGTSARRGGRSTDVAADATSLASAPTITSVDFSAAPPSIFRYVAKPSRAERDAGVEGGNTHSTVKSIALMRWLVRLVSQRGQVILDTFAGSGTTGVAALAEGRRVILIEREPRYAEITRQRCESVTFDLGVPVRVAPKAAPVAADPRQLSLLGGTP